MFRSRVFLTALLCAALTAAAGAATTPTVVNPDTAKWQPVPQFKGWEMAVIVGDPSKAGAYYAYFLKAPAGGKAMPHSHGMTENVVVISGSGMFGVGDSINTAKMMSVGPGTVISVPAGVHHYAMTKNGMVLEISGIGPDTTTYVHK